MENEKQGLVFNVQRFNLHDGDGIRSMVFLKGCPMRCLWCANPEGISTAPQLKVRVSKCVGCGACVRACPRGAAALQEGKVAVDRQLCTVCGRCAAACPAQALELVGKVAAAEELLEEIRKDFIFYRRSGGGLTLSGGEVLMQPRFARCLLSGARDEGLATAIETCGCVPWSAFEEVAGLVDLYLYDIKAVDDTLHRRLAGVSNKMVLENAQRLAATGAKIIFRTPVVPGLNDTQENIRAIGKLAKECGVDSWELLPFHQLGAGKYQMLGLAYTLQDIRPPEKERMAEYGAWAREEFGRVKVGN